MAKLKRAGCGTKLGKHYAVRIPGAKKLIRFDSLGEGYTRTHVEERLRGVRDAAPRGRIEDVSERKAAECTESLNESNGPNPLIGIQAKPRDNDIDSHEDLKRRAASAGSEFSGRIKANGDAQAGGTAGKLSDSR
ncbi:MAG: hypothetical protein LBF58_11040 [Deltaproteobacteria bacterium]|jgi:hypothetical protein|nr:hypothetical protein [Deltaproteobacteria bacterium]